MMRTPHFWQRKGLISTALLPFASLYALAFALDRRFTRKQRAPLPVISVGNITAGGAGKTPTAIALAQLLHSMGEAPHIITRGYGGRAHQAHRVTNTDTSANVGDEALLLARAAPTWVGRDRLASARAAKEAGASLVIADDALQHHTLHHDLSILVVDLLTGFGNGFLLPAGPLRQSLASAYGDRTIALAIGEEDRRQLIPQLAVRGEVWRARLTPAADANRLKLGQWLAFAGIAHPQKFYETLRAHGAVLAATEDFPDHHPYRRDELERLAERASTLGARLITTEKDAVRIPAEWGIPLETLPVRLAWEEEDAVRARLASLRTGA